MDSENGKSHAEYVSIKRIYDRHKEIKAFKK